MIMSRFVHVSHDITTAVFPFADNLSDTCSCVSLEELEADGASLDGGEVGDYENAGATAVTDSPSGAPLPDVSGLSVDDQKPTGRVSPLGMTGPEAVEKPSASVSEQWLDTGVQSFQKRTASDPSFGASSHRTGTSLSQKEQRRQQTQMAFPMLQGLSAYHLQQSPKISRANIHLRPQPALSSGVDSRHHIRVKNSTKNGKRK